MYIQYDIAEGDIVTIQATTSQRVDDTVLLERGRAQREVADVGMSLKFNLVTEQPEEE